MLERQQTTSSLLHPTTTADCSCCCCCCCLLLQIVPADLNAFLYQLETNIAWAGEELGQTETAQEFTTLARARRESINKLLWDNEAGV
jgi:hypothetical protein